MKVQQCSYGCDAESCDSESAPEVNFTAARKTAEANGWLIRPSLIKPEHLCPGCIDKVLNGGTVA